MSDYTLTMPWTELPFDVWEAISSHLPVRTLVIMCQVSGNLGC